MKAKRSSETATLEQIPNVGKAVARDLRSIGINRPDQLKGKDGLNLYHKLNETTGVRHDPCMADTLMAVVDFMNGDVTGLNRSKSCDKMWAKKGPDKWQGRDTHQKRLSNT